MLVNGTHYRTIWLHPEDKSVVRIIDQRKLPFEFVIEDLRTVKDVAQAIEEMHVRGAGLIGATAGWGMYLAAREAHNFEEFRKLGDALIATRPTAINLQWAVDLQLQVYRDARDPVAATRKMAGIIADEDAEACHQIGQHGLKIITQIARAKGGSRVNVLTHCNAGWLAFVDHGSATAPLYAAHNEGIDIHVWVDETRPRNQGARLTAWELGSHGVPHTVIADNVGGHLMQRGLVDLVITGTDRTTYTGDVANKIGTYLKALAAKDNKIPFYVALPSSTFDWKIHNGVSEIPIEQRSGDEVTWIDGMDLDGKVSTVRLTPENSPAANYAFDVTPARLVTGLITERGICAASEDGVRKLFPERFSSV